MNYDFLDSQQPWYKGRISDAQWDRMKARLTGGKDASGTTYSKVVSVTSQEADNIIANMKKDSRGYPQMNRPGGGEQYEMMEKYYNFLVDEYLQTSGTAPLQETKDKKEVKEKLREVLNNKSNVQAFKKALTPSATTIEPPKVTPVQEMVAPPKPVEPPAPPTPVPSFPASPPAQTSKIEENKPKAVKHQKLESGMSTVLKRVEKSLAAAVGAIGKYNDDLEIRLENQGNLMMSGFTKVTNVINSTTRALRDQSSTIEKIAEQQSRFEEQQLDRQSVEREQKEQERIDGLAENSRIQNFKKSMEAKLKSPGGSRLKDFLGPASALGSGKGFKKLLRRVRNPRRTMTAMRRLARMRLKRVPFVGNALARQGSKLVNFGSKAFRPIASPIGKKIATSIAGKTVAKVVGKGVGKSLIKKVPLLGAVAGVAFGIERAMKGDWLGAIGEVASGVASTVPGVGTAVSTGIDAALIAKDVAGAEEGGIIPGIASLPGSKGENDRARRDAGIQDLTIDSFKDEEKAKFKWQLKNINKFSSIYADGYQRYFSTFGWDNLLTKLKDIVPKLFSKLMEGLRNIPRIITDGARNLTSGLGNLWNSLFGNTQKGPESKGDYDVIIPLDHVKPDMAGKFPDKDDGKTFEQSKSTGAAGRERDHQDNAAKLLKAKLEEKGYRVKIVAPEEFRSYQSYDRYLKAESEKGVRLLPLHFDAVTPIGTGFLTRTRAGDAEDAAFAAPIQKVLTEFQKANPELGGIGQDTKGNATVSAGAASPTALIELGAMVQWEQKYGKDFTTTSKFDELITGVAEGIAATTPPPGNPPVEPPAPEYLSELNESISSTNENLNRLFKESTGYDLDTYRTPPAIAGLTLPSVSTTPPAATAKLSNVPGTNMDVLEFMNSLRYGK